MSNMFAEYAANYGVSVAKAISDRDWPMTEQECRMNFLQAAGREPTEDEMVTMQPDDSSQVSQYIADHQI